MWLQNNPQNQTHVNKLQSSSSFNITDDYDKQPHQWISNIMISSRALSLSEVLEPQLKSHLCIYSTSDQISEHIFEKIKNFSDIYRTYCKGSQEEFNEFITTPNLIYNEAAAELILRAVLKCFACKVVGCTITDSFVICEWTYYQYGHMPQDTLPSIQLNTCDPHSVMSLLEFFYHHAFQVSHYHQQNNQRKCRPLRNIEVKRKSFLIMRCLLVLPIGKI